jgi:hypothetical protein
MNALASWGKSPGYWMNETSGVLRPAIIALIDAYLRQWMGGPWLGAEDLAARVDGLTTKQAIRKWINDAIDRGIDPL